MIVDASVAIKWLVEDEGSEAARALLSRIDLFAPTLLHVEVANALWKKRRRGELADDPELAALPGMLATILQTIDETPMIPRALSLAIELGNPVYDCVYLAMAEALDHELVTADRRLIQRCAADPKRFRVVALDATA